MGDGVERVKEVYEITPEQKKDIEMLQDNFKEFLDGNLSENLTQIQVLAQMAEWSVFHLYLHAESPDLVTWHLGKTKQDALAHRKMIEDEETQALLDTLIEE